MKVIKVEVKKLNRPTFCMSYMHFHNNLEKTTIANFTSF